MDLERARSLFKEKTERSKQERVPTPEEAAREERFDSLHARFLAIGPKKERETGRGPFYERVIDVKFPESSEGTDDALNVALGFTYYKDPRDGTEQMNSIEFKWWNSNGAPMHMVDEELRRHRLHDFPEETELRLTLMEQTMDAVEALPMEDGRIHEDYLHE